MSTLPLLEDEMHRLVAEAQRQRIFLRLIGGLAVKTTAIAERTAPDA